MRAVPTVVTRHPAVGEPHFERGVRRDDMTARAAELNTGDVILVHSYAKLAPRLIGFGQRLHHDPAFAYWTHAAVYVGKAPIGLPSEDGYPTGIEALIEAKGGEKVRYVPLAQYDARDYAAIRFQLERNTYSRAAEPWARGRAVEYLRSQLGGGYGYLTIVTLALWSLFGGRVTIGLSGANVCSGLAAQASMYLGEVYDDPVTVSPADLAEKYGIAR